MTAASGLAQRLATETDLRQVARQLLELEPGEVARTATNLNLETALDYLMTLVQDATR